MKKLNILFMALLVLFGIRAILPVVGLRVINWALHNKLGTYEGSIQDFDLSLHRGAYQLQKLVIQKKEGETPPILEVKEIDLALSWAALLRKEISADVVADGMKLQLIDSKEKSKKQLGNEDSAQDWSSVARVLIPVAIENLKITNSTIDFTNTSLKKPLPIELTEINLKAENLRSRPSNEREALSTFDLKAILQKHANFSVEGKIDVMSKPRRADLDLKLVDLEAQTLNGILLAYLPLDVTSGKMSIFGEIATTEGRGKAYMNVFLKDGDIIAPHQNLKSLKHLGYELIAAFGNWLLKNPETQTLGMHIPIDWTTNSMAVGGSEAFWSAVENKDKPLLRGVRNTVDLKSVSLR